MRKIFIPAALIVACSFVLAPVLAQGVRYKWRDADGNLHYSDSLPADAGKRGYDVVSAHGVLMKRVEPAKSSQQLAAEQAAADKADAAQRAAESTARTNQQLLAAYPSEIELIRAQEQQLEMLKQNIKSAEVGLQSQERNLGDQLGAAADYERDGKAIPARLNEQIGDLRKQIEGQHGVIDRRKAELEKARANFAVELDHYRALTE